MNIKPFGLQNVYYREDKVQKGGLSLHAGRMKRKVRATQSTIFVNGKPAATSGIM